MNATALLNGRAPPSVNKRPRCSSTSPERHHVRPRRDSPMSPSGSQTPSEEVPARRASESDITDVRLRQCSIGRVDSFPASTHSDASSASVVRQRIHRTLLRARLRAAVRVIFHDLKRKKLAVNFARAPSDLGSQDQLCKTCTNLKLMRSDFVVSNPTSVTEETIADEPFRLGTLQSICIRAYNCSLCTTIVRAMGQQPLERLDNVINGPDTGNTFDDINSVCFAKWEYDGYLVHPKDDSRASLKPRPQTRRLRIYWSNNTFKCFYFVMMASPSHPEEKPAFLGRHIGTMKEDKERLIGRWITLCKDVPDSPCVGRSGNRESFEELRRGPYFGVIDVEEMRFKALPENGCYVALSYYWGAPQPNWFSSTRDTVLNLKERNGLSFHFDYLPKTIQDSIELVRKLGLRHLWVDALCLVTDSADSWNRNATVMDLVYGQACLTICAADGEDADAGLWALAGQGEQGYNQRDPQCIANYSDDLHLLVRFPAETYIDQSFWNARAWAFQERLFSNHCLIFAEGRMYFECSNTTLAEDVDLETVSAGRSLDFEQSHKKDWKYASGDIVRSYMESVAQYTGKEMHLPSERLEAFEPIGKLIFDRLGGRLVYGLPNSHFDWALLWTPENGQVRNCVTPDCDTPSWSWCGWDGEIVYDRLNFISDCMEDLHDWLVNHTWISYYIRDASGNLRLVWDPNCHTPNDHDVNEVWRGYSVAQAGKFGYDYYGRKIPKHWIGLERTEFTRTLPDFPVQVRTLEPGKESTQIIGRSEDLPYLQFWTWAASFYLEPRRDSDMDGYESEGRSVPRAGGREIALRRYNILDKERKWAGEITLSSRWRFDRKRPQPFIALSDARYFAREPDESEVADDSIYAASASSSSADVWNLYNVLLIDYHKSEKSPGDWTTNKTAFRVGLGKIYKAAFDNGIAEENHSGKKWTEVVLG